ncbi:NAD(P)H-binding protein [Mycolicibacterium arenosum]|uniref:NAD(P)H-binding protein n=1 Tax=Mycolicibacterium arenosum TaxID=2952157 RepID=A0ABT1LZC6_9MYCO|nr:NAD(P)H-binding protein [Mycolicibacterium sp. CAU 1645]MCP9272261.1 NAD(P)H-binding protein [Mycolicibacterium sp. CAU 1645]
MSGRIVIAGGHGKIALLLERLLADRGNAVTGLIRNPEHTADVQGAGADAVVLDLESATVDDVADRLHGADAVVFAAGAGPGSGAARKDTVDRAAAVLLADAAIAAGVVRYVMVSAMGADRRADDETSDPVFAAYLRAKAEADDYVVSRDALRSTIVRPGLLTDDAGTGLVRIAEQTGRGSIPRADVAAVLVAVLDSPGTAGRTFELIGGVTPVRDAVAALSD